MTPRRDPSQFLQLGFISLLLILLVLAGYWIFDHINFTQSMRDELAAQITNDAQALANLEASTDARINRILWEGGFFVAVLIGGLIVITRSIRHDAELRRRQQNFLAAVSHEFKSPLASIRLAAETLSRRTDNVEVQRIGERILADDDRLLQMVDNLLDTSRLEEGAAELSTQSLEIAPVIAELAGTHEQRAATQGIVIDTDVPGGLSVKADLTALRTVIGNVLDNAMKSCTAAAGKSIKIHARKTGEYVSVTITDDGMGFPPEDAAMIFEKFYRAGDEMRRTTPGTGLGLYIVRRLCTLSGAKIAAHSDGAGTGARFEVTWPAAS